MAATRRRLPAARRSRGVMNRISSCVVVVRGVMISVLIGTVLIGGAVRARPALGGTLYVRRAGSDANNGSTAPLALRTITRAAALARPGDQIIIGPGTYPEWNISPVAFGRISFVADRLGLQTGDAAGDVVIDAQGFSTGFTFNRHLAGTIDGVVIVGAGIGIYVKSRSEQAVISNTNISNCSDTGIYVQDSTLVTLFNNLVYNNGKYGILIAGNIVGGGSRGARVINNTVYGNHSRGIFFAGARVGSPDGLVINNIVQGHDVAGIEVNGMSQPGYLCGGNVSSDRLFHGPCDGRHSCTPVDVTDVQADALFINPAGPDGILGGPGYADDDFHLSQRVAGQAVNSPAVNAGSDLVSHLNLAHATTRIDGRRDRAIVDAGYHYNNFSGPPSGSQYVRHAGLYVDPTSGSDTNDGKRPNRAVASLKQAFAMAQPGNRVVLLGPPRTYHMGQVVLANSGTPGRDIRVEGNGAVIDATGFERGLFFSNQSNITLVGFDIFGPPSGIEIRGSSAITLDSCHLHGNTRRGLYVNNAGSITVQSSIIEDNGSRGIQVELGEVNVIDSQIARNPDSGVWASHSSTINVSGSWFSDNPKVGVLVENSTATIADTTVTGGRDGGVRINGGSGTLTNVTLRDNGATGAQSISSSLTIRGGSIEGSDWGISGFVNPVTLGTNAIEVSGTRVCNHRALGVNVQDSAVTLTEVNVCNSGTDGINLSPSGPVQISGTTVVGSGARGIVVQDFASPVVIQDSTIANNAGDGIQLIGYPVGNVPPHPPGPRGGPVTVEGSIVHDNGGHGITVFDGTTPVL